MIHVFVYYTLKEICFGTRRLFQGVLAVKRLFLKWIFEADPVGVQIRTVSHFNGLEETFKMR